MPSCRRPVGAALERSKTLMVEFLPDVYSRELRRGNAFVAVGALHLHGSRRVLAFLEEDGYRATRVF